MRAGSLIFVVLAVLQVIASGQERSSEAVLKNADGEEILGVIQGRIALDDGPRAVALVYGRDVARIDESGVFLRLGADLAAGQATWTADRPAYGVGVRLNLLQVVAANEPAVNERKVVTNSLPGATGITVLRMLISEQVKMPLRFRGVLGEFVRGETEGALTGSIRVKTHQGVRTVAVADLATMGTADFQ
jgi:hypothetical protein